MTAPDRIVRTVCSPNCSGTCGINVWVKDDRILKIEPAAYPEPGFERICIKGIAMAMQRVHHPDRLTQPLRRVGPRGAGSFEAISWDEAFAVLARELTRIGKTFGERACAWMTMSGNYGFKATTAPARIANTLGGTVLTHGGMMGDLSCAMGYLPLVGFGFTSNDLADLKHARYILIFGRNVADTDHSEMRFLFEAMEAGARVVMVDPRFSKTAAKADEWISVRPGTDAAFVLGMIHEIVGSNLHDQGYLLRYTNAPFLVRNDNRQLLRARDLWAEGGDGYVVVGVDGKVAPLETTDSPLLEGDLEVRLLGGDRVRVSTAWRRMRAAWSAYSPECAAEICGVPAAAIRRIAREYATSSPAWVWTGAGPQRYHNGHRTHRAYVTLGTITGNIGKAYAGVNCLDGAYGRMGFLAPPEWMAPGGRQASVLPGVHMREIIASGRPWPIKSLWLSAYGFASQSPNFARFVQEALPQLELFVVTEQLMTDAARYADLVLPCVSYYEDDMDLVASGESWWMQLRRRAVQTVGESKNDYDIFRGVAERMGHGEHWQMGAEEICRFVLERHGEPGIRAIEWEQLKRDGVARVTIPRPHVPFGSLEFKTPSGRIELYTEQLAGFDEEVLRFAEPIESPRTKLATRYPLTLISPKHVHSTHSQHTMLPWIREVLPEPRLEIHPGDAAARNIVDGARVRIFNDRGSFETHATLSGGVRPGMVSVPQGFWRAHFLSGHPAELGHITRSAVQDAILETNYPVWDILVEVQVVDEPASAPPS
jgi:molybdopterin-containing oxidoreductase family molybdopterin binding subunit